MSSIPGIDRASWQDAELVCLEISAKCTGSMCPLGPAEPDGIVRRIVRNGIPLDTLSTVKAHRPASDTDAEMILYGEGEAGCSACGCVGRWVLDHTKMA